MYHRNAVLVLCLSSVVAFCGCTKSEPLPIGNAVSAAPATTTVNVYYFHRTTRCPSCEKIEAWAQKAVEEGFADETAAGRIQWRAVNIDEPQHKHFEDDYKLQMQSVVLSEVRDGKETRWRNLDKVWDLLDVEQDFVQYVQNELRAFREQESQEPAPKGNAT